MILKIIISCSPNVFSVVANKHHVCVRVENTVLKCLAFCSYDLVCLFFCIGK